MSAVIQQADRVVHVLRQMRPPTCVRCGERPATGDWRVLCKECRHQVLRIEKGLQ